MQILIPAEVQSDTSLDEYLKNVVSNIRNLMPTGDPDLHIPPLDPYTMQDVKSDTNNKKAQISLHLQNLVLVGASKFEIKTLHADLQKLVMRLDVLFPQLVISGKYDVNGKAMKIFPIYGNGKAVIGVRNFEISADLGLTVDWSNGRISFSTFDLKIDFSEAMMNLENILGGGSLGELVNMLANSMIRPIFVKNKAKIESEIKLQVSKLLEKELKKVDIRKFVNQMSIRSLSIPDLPDLTSVNNYIDTLLNNAKSNPDLKIDPLVIENQNRKEKGIKIEIKDGRVYGLRTIHRVGNMVLNCDQASSKCLFTGEIGVDNVKTTFGTHMRWHFVKTSPSIDCSVSQIRVKFGINVNIQGKRGEAATLQSFQISQFSTPNIKVGHMGPFGKVLSFLLKLIGPLVKDKIKNAVERPMKEAVIKSLMKVTFEF